MIDRAGAAVGVAHAASLGRAGPPLPLVRPHPRPRSHPRSRSRSRWTVSALLPVSPGTFWHLASSQEGPEQPLAFAWGVSIGDGDALATLCRSLDGVRDDSGAIAVLEVGAVGRDRSAVDDGVEQLVD